MALRPRRAHVEFAYYVWTAVCRSTSSGGVVFAWAVPKVAVERGATARLAQH